MVNDNSKKIILDLCGGTGAWGKPYKDAGYDVRLITLPMFDVTDPYVIEECIKLKPYGILAAPPCTMFSLARAGAKTPRDFKEGMRCVEACLKIIWEVRKIYPLKFWALENPRGYLRQFLGQPAYHFQGWFFGDKIKKPTDIWGYFNEPKENRTQKPSYPRKGPGSWANKGKGGSPIRSITPPGFAKAFFNANK